MQLTAQRNINNNSFFQNLKSFLVWSFALTVCFLVVGFPAGFVLVSIGVLMAVLLHAVMPISSVILVGTGILALNILIVVASAALLTIKGIKPQDVTWLSWLHGDAELHYDQVYASCPLTCGLAEG